MINRDRTPPARPGNVQLPDDQEGDTEPRPPQRPASHWGEDERVAAGAAYRGVDTDSQQRRRRRASRSHPVGVPITPDMIERELGSVTGSRPAIPQLKDVDITTPVALLDREQLKDVELEIVRRSRRDSTDVATYADLVKLTNRIIEREHDDRSNKEEQANQLMQLLNRPPHEAVGKLQREVETLRTSIHDQRLVIEALTTWWKPIRAVLIFLAIAALGAVGFFVDKIMTGVEQKGEAQIRLDHLEHSITDLRQDIRDDRQHVPPAQSWLQPPTKDAKP